MTLWGYTKLEPQTYGVRWEPAPDLYLRVGCPPDGTMLGVIRKEDNLWTFDGENHFKTRDEACWDYATRAYWKPLTDEANTKVHPWWNQCGRGRKNRTLTEELANKIYDYLVKEIRAQESDRRSFVNTMINEKPTNEWRFQGVLGFGGKFWNEHNRFRVSKYPETGCARHEWVVAKANLHFMNLYKEEFEK